MEISKTKTNKNNKLRFLGKIHISKFFSQYNVNASGVRLKQIYTQT